MRRKAPKLTNLPSEVLNLISGSLRTRNRRALRMTGPFSRDAGLCATCNSDVNHLSKYCLLEILPATVHDGIAYNMQIRVQLDIQRINHVFHVPFIGRGSIYRAGAHHSLCKFTMTRNPLRLTIYLKNTIPDPVRECFVTCIVRQMHRHRAYLARELASATATVFTGPVGVAELTRCLDDVVVGPA